MKLPPAMFKIWFGGFFNLNQDFPHCIGQTLVFPWPFIICQVFTEALPAYSGHPAIKSKFPLDSAVLGLYGYEHHSLVLPDFRCFGQFLVSVLLVKAQLRILSGITHPFYEYGSFRAL